MNPVSLHTARVQQIQSSRQVSYDEAARMVGNEFTDLAVLARAYGATLQAVGFFNAKEQRAIFANVGVANRAELREKFQGLVYEYMERGLPYDSAFNRVLRERKDLANAMEAVSFCNASAPDAPGGASADKNGTADMPVKSPAMMKMMRLPADATQSEFTAAWEGFGGAPNPINPGKVFAALASLAEKEKSLTPDDAIRYAKTRYPDVWAWVESLSKSI